MPAVRLGCLVDEGRQAAGQLRGGLVAPLLRERRVPGQVEEGDRRGRRGRLGAMPRSCR